MVLQKGEKIHVIHRRYFEKEPQRHFVGLVEAYDAGVARVTGHVFAVDSVKFVFFRRPDIRTRLIAIASGDVLVNIMPSEVDLEKIVYQQDKKFLRVTDGKKWHLDISELAWR